MYTDKMVSLMCISLASRRWLSWVVISPLVLASSLANFQGAVSQNVNFTFPNFESLDKLTLLGDAEPYANNIILNAAGASAQILGTCGKLMLKESVRLLDTNSSDETAVASFSTAFTFSMPALNVLTHDPAFCNGGGDGFVFVFSVDDTTYGDPGGSLCTIRTEDDGKPTNHMFSVEFDTFRNDGSPYYDPSNNHVGVNVNSMHSVQTYNLCGNSSLNCTYLVTHAGPGDGGEDYFAWIDFYGDNCTLEVRLASRSITDDEVMRPLNPLIALPLPDIDTVFTEYMYVGFAGSGYACRSATVLRSWEFSSSGMPELSPSPSTPSTMNTCKNNRQVAAIAGVSAASGSFLVAFLIVALGWCCLCRKKRSRSAGFEHTLFWPRKFTYEELATATKNFSVEQLLGRGGFGEVYKGTLCDDSHIIAVKRIKRDSKQGEREFSAEISVISQIRHRNLVQILGWCRENNQLLLVYEYMSNSSLDVWLFDSMKGPKLTWNLRHNILRGLAAALAYLHEEWEQCIVHRDIKASNVMLDGEFNAHLGDFGLARLIDHDSMPKSTTVAGTLGYLAPELPHTRKATKQSDVYSYGVLALEIACGRPVFDGRASAEEKILQDAIWEAHQTENLLSVADKRLHNFFDSFDMTLVLTLGLLCCHPEPDSRPTMRFVHQCIIGEATAPPLPSSRPDLPNYSFRDSPLGEFGSW